MVGVFWLGFVGVWLLVLLSRLQWLVETLLVVSKLRWLFVLVGRLMDVVNKSLCDLVFGGTVDSIF